MESYVLLGGKDLLQQHGASLAAMIDSMAGNIKEKGMSPVLNLIDLLIVVSLRVRGMVDNMEGSGCMMLVLNLIHLFIVVRLSAATVLALEMEQSMSAHLFVTELVCLWPFFRSVLREARAKS